MNHGNLFPYTEFDLLGIILFSIVKGWRKLGKVDALTQTLSIKSFIWKKIKTTHNLNLVLFKILDSDVT